MVAKARLKYWAALIAVLFAYCSSDADAQERRPHVEVDVAHGVKLRDYWCGKPFRQRAESGTMLSVRWYPWRR